MAFNAFTKLNKNGFPVDVANATPTLDFYQLLASLSVTGVSPTSKSSVIYILDSEYYGLGANSSNALSGTFQCTLSKAAKVSIYVDGNLEKQVSLGAGRNIINFDTIGVAIAFGNNVQFELVRDAEDCTLSEGRFVVYQQ